MKLLIVTGLSGAGKTQTLRYFEDAGYFCVDNLPCEMLEGFIELCRKAAPPVERAAVVIDSREQVFRSDADQVLRTLDKLPMQCSILFLECRDEVLERRYNETRRRHPLSRDVRDGIRAERDMLSAFRDRADTIIDTTNLKPLELAAKLGALFADGSAAAFRLTFESFGYKRGVPFEADMVFDMRFLPNPFYEPALRPLSGTDAPVLDYISQDPAFARFLDQTEEMLKLLIPGFCEQGKRSLLVAFGCTGGRHRSVCAAEQMARRMAAEYDVKLAHRDTTVEAGDINARLGN